MQMQKFHNLLQGEGKSGTTVWIFEKNGGDGDGFCQTVMQNRLCDGARAAGRLALAELLFLSHGFSIILQNI